VKSHCSMNGAYNMGRVW